ncbi:MAG: spermidine/putrescine transporter substrate-binding protein [Glaciihabitans sp.]|jgi:spermidine/putrescine transport system substrate-binding protein|nr:spermidine/putrescine transporter substrate-binding protein [Glaciihabitans sp.]MDQ1571023.1 spermidine/putrescine transport system substrate-binding protein [Actinomycetota bacterium]
MRALPEDPMIRQLIAHARASQVSRRTVLGASTAGAAALALAACAPVGAKKTIKAAKDVSATDHTMTWANWALYLDQDDNKKYPTLEAFESQSGIQVKYDVAVDDNDSYYAKVKDQLALGQDIGADTVCLTDWMVSRWINLGYTQKFDQTKIPNISNLNPSLKNVDFDPGRHHSLPWQSGFAGLCWNKDKLPKGLKQVSDLWDPSLKGRVGVLSEMRDTIGLIMMEQGVDISAKSWGDKEFAAAIAEFRKQISSGQIRNVKGNSYADDLKNEDTIAAIVWSGDVEGINADIGKDKFAFAIPETGGTLWSDNFLIPIGSSKKSNAEKLINYYYEPTVAATVAAYVNYITPVEGAKAAMAKIDKDLVSDELIFPSDQTLSTVKGFRTLTNAEQSKYNAEFQSVILGV